MVPAMMFLLQRDIKVSIGTSLAVIVPSALVGIFQHHRFGHVDWRLALAIVPLALAGSYLGAWLAKALPAATLSRLFGGFIIVVGVYLLLRKQ
jgi:hypothetical protein